MKGVEESIVTIVEEKAGQTTFIWKCSLKGNGQNGAGLVVVVALTTALVALGPESTGI